MKYCANCGAKMPEDSQVCSSCGIAVKNANDSIVAVTQKRTGAKSKIKKQWIILGTVVLFLGIVAAILFTPRNLKMEDFKEKNVLSAIVQYGLPDRIDSDEESGVKLIYFDKVDFYGITSKGFFVYPKENELTFMFNDDDGRDVYEIIEHYCDFEENLLNIYHEFSYGDLEITTNDYDGSYLNIKIY